MTATAPGVIGDLSPARAVDVWICNDNCPILSNPGHEFVEIAKTAAKQVLARQLIIRPGGELLYQVTVNNELALRRDRLRGGPRRESSTSAPAIVGRGNHVVAMLVRSRRG